MAVLETLEGWDRVIEIPMNEACSAFDCCRRTRIRRGSARDGPTNQVTGAACSIRFRNPVDLESELGISKVRQLWRVTNPKIFASTILAAADQLRVQPIAVEKDYWVCEALRVLEEHYPQSLIIKGGTSLEKLRLVQPFSEDLDLLITEDFGGNSATSTGLRAMCETAATEIGAQIEHDDSGSKVPDRWKRAYLHLPFANKLPQQIGVVDAGRILLELSQTGGRHPNDVREISSLLSRQLAAASYPVSDFANLRPFAVQVLHPGRTLIEKLLRVNNFTVREKSHDDIHGCPRIGRQFYDIWALLGSSEVLAFLTDLAHSREVLADCLRVSKPFQEDEPVPIGSFAKTLAFDASWPLAAQLQAEHDSAMRDLYYGSVP